MMNPLLEALTVTAFVVASLFIIGLTLEFIIKQFLKLFK
jgi:hypothetical protein